MNTCKDCKWWNETYGNRMHACGARECRRHAPTFLGVLSTYSMTDCCGWPKTTGNDYCGDFEKYQPDPKP